MTGKHHTNTIKKDKRLTCFGKEVSLWKLLFLRENKDKNS